MIKFVEDEETRLKFISYPYTKLISYVILLIVLLPLAYWMVFVTPVYSSLSCQKNNLAHIDCLLQEKSLLGFSLLNVEINNLKKLERYIFGLSNTKQITLITTSDSAKLPLIGSQKKYKYPSKSFTLLTLNPKFGFQLFNQRRQLVKLINGQLPQQSLKLEVQLGWFAIFLTPVFAIIVVTIRWILIFPLETTYDFDGTNRKFTISVRSILRGNQERTYSFDKINQVTIDKKNLDLGGRIILQFIPEYNYPIEEYLDDDHGKANWEKIYKFIEQYK